MRTMVFLVLLTAALAGCLTDDAADPGSSGAAPVEPIDTAQVLRNLSPEQEGVSFATSTIEHYRIPARDGTALDTYVAVPNTDGPKPLVLQLTPYYAGGEPAGLGRLGDELLARGYAVGVSSVRGTGLSEGCFTQGGPEEGWDSAQVIEYLAGQSWSNGNVGVIGVSYDGTTPQQVWLTNTPSLKTIVPISGISDFYDYNFVNGVPINIQGFGFNAYYWALTGAVPFPLGVGNPPELNEELVMAAVTEVCTDQIETQQGGATSTVDGDKDGYWQIRDMAALYHALPDAQKPSASVYYIHGLQDWNVKPHMMEGWLDAIEDAGVPYKLLLGQWGHAWPMSTSQTAECEVEGMVYEACRPDWWDGLMVAWFDEFLLGKDTGILDLPAAQIQDDRGRWRSDAVWPSAGETVLPLGPGRLGGEGARGEATYTIMGENLVFESEAFEEETHLVGQPNLQATVTFTGPRGSLLGSLIVEESDGTRTTINHVAVSLNHARNIHDGDFSVDGIPIEVDVDFFHQDDVIPAGAKLILSLGANLESGPGPSLQPLWIGSGGAIQLDDAKLTLPTTTRTVFDAVPIFE